MKKSRYRMPDSELKKKLNEIIPNTFEKQVLVVTIIIGAGFALYFLIRLIALLLE